jgi:hypothetical protein
VNDIQVIDGNYYYSYKKRSTKSDMVNASATLSKGFFKAHLKTSLDVNANWSQGEQYSADNVLDYNFSSISLRPSLVYSPSFMEIDYSGSFGWSRSKVGGDDSETLFDWKQSLSLTSTIGIFDLSLSGALHHNELQNSHSVNLFLANESAVLRLKRVRLHAELRNIFNKKTYSVTNYSGVGVFTNNYELRPREFLISAQFNLGL